MNHVSVTHIDAHVPGSNHQVTGGRSADRRAESGLSIGIVRKRDSEVGKNVLGES